MHVRHLPSYWFIRSPLTSLPAKSRATFPAAGKCVHRISLSFDAFESHEFAGKCVRGIGLSFDACLLIGLLCHVNSRENTYTGLVIRLKLDLLIGLGR